MISQPAGESSGVIVAPEMAVFGYSFGRREAIAPYVESIDGPTVSAVADLARLPGV